MLTSRALEVLEALEPERAAGLLERLELAAAAGVLTGAWARYDELALEVRQVAARAQARRPRAAALEV